MIDISVIRDAPEHFERALDRRGRSALRASEIIQQDQDRRAAIQAAQFLQEQRNRLSDEAGQAKRNGDDGRFQALAARLGQIKGELPLREAEAKEANERMTALLAGVPNLPADDVPDGHDETQNVEVRRIGEIRQPTGRAHDILGPGLGLMDFEAAARLSGSRYTVLRGPLARMERALGQFMLNTHVENGYEEVATPAIVNPAALFGTGQLPKFKDDLFTVGDGAQYLIPTAEVTLTNLVANTILAPESLPLRMVALTPCFRSEAGSAGRDTRGMLRQHQFNKVELVAITAPEESDAEHERMLDAAEGVLKALDLPYRVVKLCAGDMGFSARRTYDIEVWMPGQETYREISSVSTCGDFQARRMNARTRTAGGEKQFAHTLNGSGVAVGRALIAVMENYQNPDGSITVPEVLRPLMGGLEAIR